MSWIALIKLLIPVVTSIGLLINSSAESPHTRETNMVKNNAMESIIINGDNNVVNLYFNDVCSGVIELSEEFFDLILYLQLQHQYKLRWVILCRGNVIEI